MNVSDFMIIKVEEIKKRIQTFQEFKLELPIYLMSLSFLTVFFLILSLMDLRRGGKATVHELD